MELCADSSFEVVHCCEGPALGRLGASLVVLWIVVVVRICSIGVQGVEEGMGSQWVYSYPFSSDIESVKRDLWAYITQQVKN